MTNLILRRFWKLLPVLQMGIDHDFVVLQVQHFERFKPKTWDFTLFKYQCVLPYQDAFSINNIHNTYDINRSLAFLEHL